MQPFVHRLCTSILQYINVSPEQDASLFTCATLELYYYQKFKRSTLSSPTAQSNADECYAETMNLCACLSIALKYIGYDELFVSQPSAIYVYCLRAITLYMKQEVYNRNIKSGFAMVSIKHLFNTEYNIFQLTDWKPFPNTIKAFGYYSQSTNTLSKSASVAQLYIEQQRSQLIPLQHNHTQTENNLDNSLKQDLLSPQTSRSNSPNTFCCVHHSSELFGLS